MSELGFCTYLHRRNDTGQVFYVGKGRPSRATSNGKRSLHWGRVAKRHGHTVEICAMWREEPEAFTHEKFLIDTFRSMGHPLVNHTTGGEGKAGMKTSEKTKALMSAAHRRRWESSPELREAASARSKLLRTDPEFVAKNQAALALAKMNPAFSERMSRAVAASWARPEVRAQRVIAVECIDTGEVFESSRAAAEHFGISRNGVTGVCTGARKSCGGHEFRHAAREALSKGQTK